MDIIISENWWKHDTADYTKEYMIKLLIEEFGNIDHLAIPVKITNIEINHNDKTLDDIFEFVMDALSVPETIKHATDEEDEEDEDYDDYDDCEEEEYYEPESERNKDPFEMSYNCLNILISLINYCENKVIIKYKDKLMDELMTNKWKKEYSKYTKFAKLVNKTLNKLLLKANIKIYSNQFKQKLFASLGSKWEEEKQENVEQTTEDTQHLEEMERNEMEQRRKMEEMKRYEMEMREERYEYEMKRIERKIEREPEMDETSYQQLNALNFMMETVQRPQELIKLFGDKKLIQIIMDLTKHKIKKLKNVAIELIFMIIKIDQYVKDENETIKQMIFPNYETLKNNVSMSETLKLYETFDGYEWLKNLKIKDQFDALHYCGEWKICTILNIIENDEFMKTIQFKYGGQSIHNDAESHSESQVEIETMSISSLVVIRDTILPLNTKTMFHLQPNCQYINKSETEVFYQSVSTTDQCHLCHKKFCYCSLIEAKTINLEIMKTENTKPIKNEYTKKLQEIREASDSDSDYHVSSSNNNKKLFICKSCAVQRDKNEMTKNIKSAGINIDINLIEIISNFAVGFMLNCNNNECQTMLHFDNIFDLRKLKKNCYKKGVEYYDVKECNKLKARMLYNNRMRLFCSKCIPKLKQCLSNEWFEKCPVKDIMINEKTNKCYNHPICYLCDRHSSKSIEQCIDCDKYCCYGWDEDTESKYLCGKHNEERKTLCRLCIIYKEQKIIKQSIMNSSIISGFNDDLNSISNVIAEYAVGITIICCNEKCDQYITFHSEWDYKVDLYKNDRYDKHPLHLDINKNKLYSYTIKPAEPRYESYPSSFYKPGTRSRESLDAMDDEHRKQQEERRQIGINLNHELVKELKKQNYRLYNLNNEYLRIFCNKCSSKVSKCQQEYCKNSSRGQ